MQLPADSPDDILVVDDDASQAGSGSKLRAYCELCRLPAAFTALADVLLGFFFTHGLALRRGETEDLPWGLLALLLGASASLYTAGMVLNDFFDAEVDARERPGRPIPSGRVARGTAGGLGAVLLVLGAVLGWLASYGSGKLLAGLVATALAGTVISYDGLLKKTPLGPLAMGACRFLNVLLGMSVAADVTLGPAHYLVAGGVGLYIVGVTVFARREAEQSGTAQLALGCLIMAAGIVLIGWYPDWADRSGVVLAPVRLMNWRLLLGLFGLLVVKRCAMAIVAGGAPAKVQQGVANALRSLILLDAFACVLVAGVTPAIAIMLLLLPMLLLGRWLYST
jgi:4-hydroxybenzoate polyprenyltransferase